MTHTEILTAISTKLSATANLPQRIYQNTPLMSTIESEYLEVYIMPLQSENQAFSGVERKSGLIQINVVVAVDTKMFRSAQICDLILAAFKQGTAISTGLKVSRPSYVSAGIKDGVRYVVPVTIQYQNLAS